jgi:hypothetical protein
MYVLEVGGGYQSGIARYLPLSSSSSSPSGTRTGAAGGGGNKLHHNVEPVSRGSTRRLKSGWRTDNLPLGFEDYQLPPQVKLTCSNITSHHMHVVPQ